MSHKNRFTSSLWISSALTANDNSKQTVIITNTISTGEMTRDDFTAIQFYIECSNIWNGLVQINNYIFGDSIMVGVRILNIAKVYILNTQFRNIQVIREMKDLGQCSKFAAGLTAVSSLVNMKNTTFSNVSAESAVPSSIYVDIKSVYGLPNQLIMNNVIVETNSLQNWVDDMIWHLSTDWNDFKESRNNVTMKCLGGHQKIRKIGNEKNEFLYCVR